MKTKYLTPRQAAEKLEVPRSNIYFWIKHKKLEARRIGGRYRITEQAIHDFSQGEVPDAISG